MTAASIIAEFAQANLGHSSSYSSRVFSISEPRVGSRSTNQISPRRGLLIRLACQIGGLPFSPFRRLGVVFARDRRLGFEDFTALRQRKREELAPLRVARLYRGGSRADGYLPRSVRGGFSKRCWCGHILAGRMNSSCSLRKSPCTNPN